MGVRVTRSGLCCRMGILPAQLFFKWGFMLQGAEPTVGWIYYLHNYSLNRGSRYKELSQQQIKLPSGSLFQGYVLVANFISSTSPTFDFALNLGFELQGADHAVEWVYYPHNYSLNRGSRYKELSQQQIKLPSGSLFQGYVLVANFISSTSPTFDFALNPFPLQGAGILLPLGILAKWTLQNSWQQLFPQVPSSPTFNHAHFLWLFITR